MSGANMRASIHMLLLTCVLISESGESERCG